MSAPEEVRLKRKRTDDPLETLLLTRTQLSDQSPSKKIRYVLKGPVVSKVSAEAVPKQDEIVQTTTTITPEPKSKEPASRTFHLKRPRPADDEGYSPKRARNNAFHVPIFEEDPARIFVTPHRVKEPESPSNVPQPYPTKRPGRGSALRHERARSAVQGRSPPSNADLQALADSMHQFALDELAKIPKPTSRTKPRMSPAQSKSRHDRAVASASASPASTIASDAMDIDGDFVYDTYVLTDSIKTEDDLKGDVGLLVIRDDDEEYWQSLLDNEQDEEEVDEEDENAEDHYAADYPEDELASDDEYDNNAYSFRPRANSDVEQWDHRDGDDDEEDADSDPFSMRSQMVKRWEQELGFTALQTKD